MRHPAPVFGWVAVVVVIAVAMPAGAQELQALGRIRAAGVATSEASRKIVSSLRALIAEFRAAGITRDNAAALDAGPRFSSEVLRVDRQGRVQVYVTVADTGEAALARLRTVGNVALRVSAAGNERLQHYQATFTPGVFDAEIPGTRHNFGGGDTLMRFRVPGGRASTIVLQWGNRFGAAGDDYDVCVRQASGALAACSAAVQNGDDDPIEAVSVGCPAPSGVCAGDIQITRFARLTRPLELFCLGCIVDEFVVPGDSIIGPPAVPEVLAVAAAPAGNPAVTESFSSAGPSTILFPAQEVRVKPDVTGIDGVVTSRPGFNPFFGTSAAAPHVAAVAALLLQRQPALTPPQLSTILRGSAIDLAPAGFDFAAGFGRVAAASGLAATPTASVVFRADFDNDGRADVGVYRPGTAQWLIRRSSDGALVQVAWGAPSLGDVPVPANYVGEGRSDVAIYRTTTGQWFIRSSDDATLTVVSWGSPPLGDVPLTRQP